MFVLGPPFMGRTRWSALSIASKVFDRKLPLSGGSLDLELIHGRVDLLASLGCRVGALSPWSTQGTEGNQRDRHLPRCNDLPAGASMDDDEYVRRGILRMVIGLIIGLRITADQQRPEQTGAAAVRRSGQVKTTTRAKKCRMFVRQLGYVSKSAISCRLPLGRAYRISRYQGSSQNHGIGMW